MATDIGKVDFSSAMTVVGATTRNRGDGDLLNFAAGSYGDLQVSEFWGKYGTLARKSVVYSARVATAASIVANSALTNAPTLWNPAGSGKWLFPLKILFSVGAVGTPILQGFTLSYLNNAGSTIATAGPVPTATFVATVPMKLGGAISAMLWAPAAITFTTNPAILMDLGIGHHLEGAAASGQHYTLMHDFDTELLIPPGSLICLGSTIASSTTYNVTILYAELPMSVS